jgi:anti-sigma factor RsiW
MTSTLTISTRRLRQLERLADKRDQALAEVDKTYAEMRTALEAAREEGATLDECAEAIGGSRQRVWKFLRG